jgi:hypothetical protein
MFSTIDAFLAQKVQKVCDFLFETVGITKYRIAIWLYILSYVFSGTAFMLVLGNFGIAYVVLYAPVLYFRVRELEKHEKHFFSTGNQLIPIHNGIAHKKSFREFMILFVALCFSLFCIDLVLGEVLNISLLMIGEVSYLLWMYVVISTPKPPSARKKKLERWLESFRLSPSILPA